MKLSVRHRFDCSPSRFWEMYWDDAFDRALSAESTVTREVLSERDEGGVLHRRLRFTPQRELPRAVATLLGSSKLVYEQQNAWDRAAGVMTWEVIPTVLPGKLAAKGDLRSVPDQDGCAMVVQGEISVNVRFVGGQIEKAVVDEVSGGYDRMAVVCRSWLKEHGR